MIELNDAQTCAKEIVKLLGNTIIVAAPLGLGKPVEFLNALYTLAKDDPAIDLTILTALTFCKPYIKNEFAGRLIKPYLHRIYENYEDLLYELDRRAQRLPKNIKVIEFFLSPGSYLHNSKVQQDFIYTNYTHVVRDSVQYKINVFAQMISSEDNKEKYSLSCNVDLTKDILKSKKDILLVGEINKNLPYMYGEQAQINAEEFTFILNPKKPHKKLFSIPKEALSPQDFMIGLYVSSLIKDDGSLQMGIGTLSDAVTYALILRHKHNEQYKEILTALSIDEQENATFTQGLFAPTEMLVDGYLELFKHGILKKQIKDDAGSFVAHAGFFVGSNNFYEQLNKMPIEQRKLFNMRSISEINQLYHNEETKRQQRKNARFVNSCMKATLLGAAVSDSLEDGTTVSGVGGQYNFVAMAHELYAAHSILTCRSTREKNGILESNIVFEHPSITIPRHLRDIVVTEYGIAKLRGKTDEEVIKCMLTIADSRFQEKLLMQAKKSKKIAADYKIPQKYRNNFPKNFEKLNVYEEKDFFNPYPFKGELTQEEISLEKLLKEINKKSKFQLYKLFLRGIFTKPKEKQLPLLKRMDLVHTKSIKEIFYKALLLGTMNATRYR